MLRSNDQTIGKFITIAAPWLGAPKAINVLEQGAFLDPGFQQFVTNDTFKALSEFYPAVHELLPSEQYFKLVNNPLSFYGRPVNDYNEYAYIMNQRFPRSNPGQTNSIFHSPTGQDNEKVAPFAEQYVHFAGNGLIKDTITSVNIISQCSRETPPSKCAPKYELTLGTGDTTVPRGSAERGYGTAQDLNALGATLRIFPGGNEVRHGDLVMNQNVIVAVLTALGAIPPKTGASAIQSSEAEEELPQQPAYYFELTGTDAVTITDETGHTTNPLSQPADAGLANLTSYITGPKSTEAIISLDQNYTVTWRAQSDPLQLSISRELQLPDMAFRYLDLQLTAGVMCSVKLTPLGVDGLRCDKDGDGTFETLIAPTSSASGTDAQDKTPPSVNISSAPQSSLRLITIAAEDSGSGVKAIYYAVGESTFAEYKGPFTVDPLTNPVISAFADDNVANRSGLVTFALPTPTPLELLLEESGSTQAAALDSILFLRDPFPVVNAADLLNLGVDGNTRVIVFVMNLQLMQGETSSSVVVNLLDSNNQSYDVAAEDVRSLSNLGFTQVIFRLPNNIPAGTCTIKINAHGQVSNAGTIRIGN